LPVVIGVEAEADCPRDVFRYDDGMFFASPHPRPIPGVSPDRNLHGTSFAVANMTGFAARALLHCSRSGLRETLIAGAENTVSRRRL
jgi:hypothetical protein